MDAKKPTIKGIFVNSHIAAVKEKLGSEGVKKLESLFGSSLSFKNSDKVFVSDEVKIIEFALDLLSDRPVDPAQRAFEAGRLHFRNFTSTPLATIIFSVFRSNFKFMMLHASDIAGHVFEGVQFASVDTAATSVTVTMRNNDYPIDHFRGLFYEWMKYAGFDGTVQARSVGDSYEYIMTWKQPDV